MTLLAIRGLAKSFAGVPALRDARLEVESGEVHALLGENGAGKSTLMRCILGALQPDAGTMLWHGEEHRPASPADALRAGICLIHQEQSLVPELDVAANVTLGREPRRGAFFVDESRAREVARRALERIGAEIDPSARVGDLTFGERQMVEIARALAVDARLLLFDEATAGLSPRESERLFTVVGDLKRRGAGIVWITHRLEEVGTLCDRATIFRDGAAVSTDPVSVLDRQTIVSRMVGRTVANEAQPGERKSRPESREVLLEVRGFTRPGAYSRVTLELRKGEILGLFGLVGSGRSELALGMLGAPPPKSGEMAMGGAIVRVENPRQARALGLVLLGEDRKRQGIIPDLSVRANIALLGESDLVTSHANELRLRPASLDMPIQQLSGGNQQKALFARALLADATVLLADEPTRGVDVAAKVEIHELLRRFAAQGRAVLLISSEVEEIRAVADRIAVMREGRIVEAELQAESSAKRILAAALPVRG